MSSPAFISTIGNVTHHHHISPSICILIPAVILVASACHALAGNSGSVVPLPPDLGIHNEAEILLSGGLINLGNTCYLNAQLQCAYHIPRVRELILDPPIVEYEDGEDYYPSKGLSSLQKVFSSMATASRKGGGMINTNSKANPNPSLIPAVSTITLCRSLGINVYEQQDSQEFWKLLLPELDLPSLTQLYKGTYSTYITPLDGSGREKKRKEPFLDLSLDVLRSSSVLESMEEMFQEGEVLSVREGNGWRPEKGAEKVDALKGNLLEVDSLPRILQLHLMRFRYDWQTDVMSKINDRFVFPKELDLSSICTDIEKDDIPRALYDLQSIVVHAGEYGSGHYYAYVRPDIRKNKWYRFDDDRVTKVSFMDVKADASGGQTRSRKKSSKQKNVGFFGRILGFNADGGNFGWGGKKSCAYMLQYVRRVDIPTLYGK